MISFNVSTVENRAKAAALTATPNVFNDFNEKSTSIIGQNNG
jgi:hypothetical protein